MNIATVVCMPYTHSTKTHHLDFHEGLMRRYGLRSKIYPALGIVGWTSGIIGAALAALDKVNANTLPATLAMFVPIATWLKDRDWWYAPMFVCVAGLCAASQKWIGEPWVWNAIHQQLNVCQRFVFSEQLGEPLDEHRVTLFRHFQWWQYPCSIKRPWMPRLIPVERSGHLTQKCETDFAVPDRAATARGLAAQVWRTQFIVTITDLPDLYSVGTKSAVEEYAQRTWSEPDWVRERLRDKKSLARSLCGIPIKVKGREWGVLIIDSKDPKGVADSMQKFYDLNGQSLGQLLERV